MQSIELRLARNEDTAAIVALNADSVALTSPMDAERYQALAAMSALVLVAQEKEDVIGFLMAFAASSAYDSANYRWFDERLRHFLYVDRIVVGEAARGMGLGQRFYAQVFDVARAAGHAWVAAEMNLEPPNLPSLSFHAKHGFHEVGRQTLPGGKTLSMQIYPLEAAHAQSEAP